MSLPAMRVMGRLPRCRQGMGAGTRMRRAGGIFQLTTAIFMPEGHDADELREVILQNFDMSLGAGLSKLARKVFRIGHLGHFNDLTLMGALSGVEMGLRLAGVPHRDGGVKAAMDALVAAAEKSETALAK